MDHQEFIDRFYNLLVEYKGFLEERNYNGGYKHGQLRVAFRSLQESLPLIFMYTDFPKLKIPPTTNHLEGAFSYLKEKIEKFRNEELEHRDIGLENKAEDAVGYPILRGAVRALLSLRYFYRSGSNTFK